VSCTPIVHSDRHTFLSSSYSPPLGLLFVCFLSVLISTTLFVCCLFYCVRFNFFSVLRQQKIIRTVLCCIVYDCCDMQLLKFTVGLGLDLLYI